MTPSTQRGPARARLLRALPRVLLLVGLLAAPMLLLAGPASAHAGLVSADPAAGSVLRDPPEAVTLGYTEDVSVQPDGVRVLDARGERVDAGRTTASGEVVTAPLDAELPSGTYAVSWRVVSTDGHVVQGAHTFSVRVRGEIADDVVAGAFDGSDTRDEIVAAVLRGLVYLAILGAGGAVVVGGVLGREGERSVVAGFVPIVAGIGVLATLLQLPVQASLMTGRGFSSVTEGEVFRQVLEDGVGPATFLQVVGLVLLAATASTRPDGVARIVPWVGAALTFLGPPLTGHTRTMSPLVVGMASDLVHVVTAALWFGGLVALVRIVRRRRLDDDLAGAGEAVARFSSLATVAVAALVIAGVVMGWMEAGGLGRLFGATYGRVLIAKVVLVGLVLIGAWWNRSRFVPGLARAEAGVGWETFRRVVRLEVIGIVIVIALTAVLVNLTPGRADTRPAMIVATDEFGDGRVEVALDPGRVGPNVVHVFVYDDGGQLSPEFDEVEVRLSLPDEEIVGIEVPVVRVGPGHFQVVNVAVPLPGEWEVRVVARPDPFTETSAVVELEVD